LPLVLLLLLKWLLTLIPFCQADAVADKADQKRNCLSEASFCASRLGSRCGGYPRSGRRERGRLLFAYFILGEARKSERLPGRTRLLRPKKNQHRATEERTAPLARPKKNPKRSTEERTTRPRRHRRLNTACKKSFSTALLRSPSITFSAPTRCSRNCRSAFDLPIRAAKLSPGSSTSCKSSIN
jgi:hypothetical protein